ncbi:MAG TPA: peroxiredoxin [Longimicrobium sp.]|nr:peroxiredoxin [Longimicrobium sp.]
MGLNAGEKAPDVTLPSHENQQVPLSTLWKDGPAVLLFFPLAFTSTCTAEMCNVRDDFGAYTGLGANVAAISVDSPFVLNKFRDELGAPYTFLSDFNREASTAFGVLRKSPLGPGLLNASDRAAFVVGQDGTVRYAWHEPNPGLLPPFDEIKAALSAS